MDKAPLSNSTQDQYLDLRKVVNVVKKKWYFFIIAQVLFIALAFVLGKVIPPTYEVATSIYVKENGAFESQKAMEFLQSFQLFDQKRTFQNEMLILKSTPLVTETVEQLDLEIQYYESESYIDTEIYKQSPFIVLYDSSHVQAIDVAFTVVFFDDGEFHVTANNDDVKVLNYSTNRLTKTNKSLSLDDMFFQSDAIEDELYKFRIYLKNPSDASLLEGNTYRFVFKDKVEVVEELQNNLKVAPENPEVSVVEMVLQANSYEKAIDFTSTLTNIYLRKNLERKNHFAFNTISYINQQLEEISDSLNVAERRLERFRSGNQVMDISSKAGRIFERMHQLELEKSTVDRQYKYYQYLDEFFEDNDNLADLVVPSSMGISDQTLNELMHDLIRLVNQRNELIGKKQDKSPYLKNLEVQIESLKRPIIENINFSITTLERTLADLTVKIDEMKNNIEALPKTERQLVGFERKFQLNDAIYTFLLQRRAEAQIAKASNLPEHEIVEPARLVRKVYPNPIINYSLAVFLGLLVPALILLLIGFFDDRIKGEQSLEEYKDIPYLGAIIRNEESFNDVVARRPSSPISETFRTIRTNLFFFLKGESHKSILVTSAVSAEGKSFMSLNLALSLAQLNKKVVLVGYDLRKSNQFKDLVANSEKGLTSYYVKKMGLKSIIQPSNYINVDVITPGVIPPNPMELIGHESTATIFAELRKKYDYIVIDSSPIGVVSDAYLLMEHSDVNLFVIREHYSREHIVKGVLKEVLNKNIPKLALVLNASRMEGKKYRYDYYNKYDSKSAKLK
ncbi:GumC family protein [Carboxylicivirga sp. N1Y90]|uniref:GumC family protein n=1 Tax=Carboxylicivirga fragile TaxID=3417571 RepID=UPI003D33688E|nr:polysaccharide biosynthesis tyrosine autokinase [Marinilabiliaceae bacterium N1Y90]